MVRLVLYRASNKWCWYLLPLNVEFNNLLTPDGHDPSLRKALVHAREYAKEKGLSISYIELEK